MRRCPTHSTEHSMQLKFQAKLTQGLKLLS